MLARRAQLCVIALGWAVLCELRQVHTELEELKTQRELGRLRVLHELAGTPRNCHAASRRVARRCA